MDVRNYLWDAARSEKKRALPILSFPAAQRLGVSVEELVKNAELQCRAMELIAHETDTLAVVSLMDLSMEAEAFGAAVHFSANELPSVSGQLIDCLESAEELEVPSLDAGRAKIFIEAVSLAKEKIQDKPLFAGMIGPYSLAGRLMDVMEIMYICFDEPEAVHAVLEKTTQYLINYGHALKAAGADGILMAEPLAGILSPDMAEEFSVPYVTRIIEALQDDDFAVLYHNCGNSVPHMLDALFSQGAAAYHFGNAVDMAKILESAPTDILCMGNLDPAAILAEGTPEEVTAATKAMMAACGSYSNYIPSSGCDIPAHASWENLEAFFAAL